MVLTPRKPDKKYFGIAETSFKDHFRNHTRGFRHKKYVNSTKLSKYMWKLKDEKIATNKIVEYNVNRSWNSQRWRLQTLFNSEILPFETF